MIRPWLVVALVLAGTAGLPAQEPAVLSGRVVDARTLEGIPVAEAGLGNDLRPVESDGRFRLGAVHPGRYTFTARAIGYSVQAREVTVLPGQSLTLEIALIPVAWPIDSMEITATRESVLEGDALAARGGDLATALNGWEGIVVSRTGHGNEAVPQIRGSAADEVLVLVDGFALNDPFSGRADLSRVVVRDVARVSLLRGVQTPRGGSRAIAGILQISTRRSYRREITLGAGSSRTGQARMAGSIGPAALAVSLEALPRDYTVDYPSGSQGPRANAGGEIWTMSGQADIGLRLFLRGSMSDRGLPGTTVNPTPTATAEDRSLFLGARTGDETWASASVQWLDTRAADPAPPPGFVEYDAHTWGSGGTLDVGVRRPLQVAGWNGHVTIGADARHDRFDGDAVRADATFSRAGSTLAASMGHQDRAGAWSLGPALRLDWYSGRSSPLLSGRLDAQYSRRGTTLSAAVGNGVTVPALADLLFRDGVGVSVNPDLRPERVRWEAELGLRQEFARAGVHGSFRVAGFHAQIDDMILWTPNFRFIWSPGNFAVVRRGAEANLDLHVHETLAFSASGTLSRVTYDSPEGSPVPYRPRTSFSAQGSWTPGTWRVNLGWNRLGVRYSRNRKMNPLAAFDLFTLGVERRFGRLSARGEIRDLTDARPVYIAGFPTPGRTFHLSMTLEFP